MTVNELIKLLQSKKFKGAGNYPVQLMVVEGGVTYAEDIAVERADKRDDGERVWIYGTERHNPEWLNNV